MKQTPQHHSTHTLAAKSFAAISLAFLVFIPCQSMGIQAYGSISSDLPAVCTDGISSLADLNPNSAIAAAAGKFGVFGYTGMFGSAGDIGITKDIGYIGDISYAGNLGYTSNLTYTSNSALTVQAGQTKLNQMGIPFSSLRLVPSVQKEDAEVVDSLFLSSRSPEQSRPFLIHNMAPGDGQSREYRLEIIHSQNAIIHFMLHIDEETKNLGDELTIHIAYGDEETVLYKGPFEEINDLEFSIPVPVNDNGQSEIDWWIDANLPTSAGNEVQQAMLKATLNWRMVYADPSIPVNPSNPISPNPAGPSNPSNPASSDLPTPTGGGTSQNTPSTSPTSSFIRAITSSPINTALASFVISWKESSFSLYCLS